MINKYELTPDIMTFGALALGCGTFKLAQTFMDEMRVSMFYNINYMGDLCMKNRLGNTKGVY